MQFFHSVDGLHSLLCFNSGWYWFFLSIFSASFRSSCRAGLVVMKSLSNCLFIKDFISPSLMKLSLAGYEILGWKFFFLRMLNIDPHACRVSVDRSTVSLMGSLCRWPCLSLWLSLTFFLLFQSWRIWWLCVLGLIFLWSILVVSSVFPEFECWSVLLGWGSSTG